MKKTVLIILTVILFQYVYGQSAKEFYVSGISKFKEKDLNGAIKDFNKAIELDSTYAVAYVYRSGIKNDLGDFNGSIVDITKAIELEPNEFVYYNRGLTYQRNKKYKEAIQDYNTAMNINPKHFGAVYNSGLSKQIIEDYNGSILDLTKYIALDTLNDDAYYLRGISFYNNSQKNEACKDWNIASKKGNMNAQENIKLYCQLELNKSLDIGLTKYSEGDYKGALENINTYLITNPNSIDAIITKAHCKYMLKDYLGAINDYNTCLIKDSKNIDAVFYRARSNNELGNYKLAIEDYNICIKLNPKNIDAYNYRGQCYDNLKDYKNALLDYNKVIALNPKIFENEIYFNRALVKTSLSDDLGAINDYTKALIYNSKNAAIYINRGLLKFSIKDYLGALSDYNSALNIEPSFGMVYYYRGLTYLELKNNKKACEDLKIANDVGVELIGIKFNEVCK